MPAAAVVVVVDIVVVVVGTVVVNAWEFLRRSFAAAADTDREGH